MGIESTGAWGTRRALLSTAERRRAGGKTKEAELKQAERGEVVLPQSLPPPTSGEPGVDEAVLERIVFVSERTGHASRAGMRGKESSNACCIRTMMRAWTWAAFV